MVQPKLGGIVELDMMGTLMRGEDYNLDELLPVAKWLAQQMKRTGLGQAEVARRTGIHKSQIFRVMNAHKPAYAQNPRFGYAHTVKLGKLFNDAGRALRVAGYEAIEDIELPALPVHMVEVTQEELERLQRERLLNARQSSPQSTLPTSEPAPPVERGPEKRAYARPAFLPEPEAEAQLHDRMRQEDRERERKS